MATANININGNGLNVNVASPRSKIVNTSTPNVTAGKPVVKTPAPAVEQKDLLVNILGVLKGTGIADPHQFKYRKDLFRTSEEVISLFEKFLLDNSVSSDLITNILFEKAYNDTTLAIEEQKFDVAKGLETEYTYSDEDRYAVIKVLEDSALVPDELKSFVSKVIYDSSLTTTELKTEVTKLLNDYTINTDLVTTLWGVLRVFSELTNTDEELVFDSTKWLLDSYDSTDTPYKSLIKPRVDTGSIEDLVKHVTWFRRTYLDHVYATDDVLGEANIDDDQYASVIKAAIDTTDVVDIHEFNMHSRQRSIFSKPVDIINYEIGRLQLDTYSVYDINSFISLKYVEEVVNNQDIFKLYLDKVIQYDSATLVDKTTNDINKNSIEELLLVSSIEIDTSTNQADTVYYSDPVYKLYSKNIPIEYTSIFEHMAILAVGKVVVNTTELVELINKDYYKVLTPDNFIAQEFVYKEFIRPTEDDYFFMQADVITIQPNKGVVEVVGTSEVGYMNKQSYFAEDYVIPGYSGTDYTF